MPVDWSRDGRYVLGCSRPQNVAIWVVPLFGDRKPLRYLNTASNETWPKLSPDGQWIAYVSDENRQKEVFSESRREEVADFDQGRRL